LIQRHLKTTVTLETIGKVDVSTIDLSHTGIWTGYETCLFWRELDSDVVETYGSWEQAQAGHARWTDPAVLAEWFVNNVRMHWAN
jgi:hypothetical protein